MLASILIVSKNRKEALEKTLIILEKLIDFSNHEVLVFLDGCTDGSDQLKKEFDFVKWYGTDYSIGASAARHILYPKAKGHIFIGLDDDAHPLYSDFVVRATSVFKKYPNVGVVAFQEIKGIFASDAEALRKVSSMVEEYFTNEFIGCGFAIRKEVYNAINGFPVWIDIYGEESCVSLEVIAKGYDIIYSNIIKVNHRVDVEERRANGQNYFRFGKQLKNSTYYFLVYYPFPLINILKLYWHNFKKYALNDSKFFNIFFKTLIEVILNFIPVLKYRQPVNKCAITKMRSLKGIQF